MADFRLRVTYSKAGRLCMLSHLEICRALERNVRRAGLPYAVSQGFSPHMKIAFGAALPVGVGSTCEIFDVTLTDYVAPDRALAALTAASPESLKPHDAVYIAKSDAAASVALPVSTYRTVFDGEASACVLPETVTVVRKKKEKVLSTAEFLMGQPEASGNSLEFTLCAKPTGSLRPDILVDAMLPEGLHLQALTRIAQRSLEA